MEFMTRKEGLFRCVTGSPTDPSSAKGLFRSLSVSTGEGKADTGDRDKERHEGNVTPFQFIFERFNILPQILANLLQLLAGFRLLLAEPLDCGLCSGLRIIRAVFPSFLI